MSSPRIMISNDGRYVDIETVVPFEKVDGNLYDRLEFQSQGSGIYLPNEYSARIIEAARREMDRVDMEDIAKASGYRLTSYYEEPDDPPAFAKRNNRHERRKAWKLSRRKK